MTLLSTLSRAARRRVLSLVPLLAPLVVLTAAAPSVQAQGRAERPPFPVLNLPESKAFGARAIEVLGDRLPEVAAFYGKTADQLRALLEQDRRLKVDRRGRLFYEEELERPLPVTGPTSFLQSDSVSGTLAPLDQTFLLHSRPGAKRTIYLNFRGATLTGTAWNSSGTTINALPFDLDGIPGTFSTAELQRIQAIWQRVAEDFAPLDVNVTTEAPSADRLTRSGSTDDVYGTTALITSSSGVYNCSCGGVAYLGVYDDTSDYYKPALVFYNQLGGGNEKYVAEAISHEVGHNGGLNHDGTASVGYYQGHGSGATGWAPIMGVGYYQSLVQWSKGEYSGANNTQDDFVVMAGNGLPLRPDDHGNAAGTATVMSASSSGGITSLRSEGVIERASDVDVFSFAAAAGSASLTITGAARSSNLDAQIDLRDAAGNLLATANPVDALGASLSVVLPSAGTYYVSVRGVGKGDPATTGYSPYGSVGQYVLTGSVYTASGQAPVAAATASSASGTVPLTVNFSGAGSTDPDGSIVSYAWTFGNGTSASGATGSTTYNTAGTYTATLQVTDNSGLTASSSVTITVNPQVVTVPMWVSNIAMTRTIQRNGNARANAAVTVVDGNGRVVPGATVSGRWGGIVSGTASVLTGSNGVASFSSANTKSTGTFTFTVTGVTLPGYVYDAAKNIEVSDSITR